MNEMQKLAQKIADAWNELNREFVEFAREYFFFSVGK